MKARIFWALGAMMFFQFFVWGCWYVTMGAYINELGFNGVQFGWAYSTTALGAIFAPLVVGIIADRYFEGQKILGFLHIVGGIILYLVTFITSPQAFFWIMLLYTICYMPTLAIANAVAFNQMDDPKSEFPKVRVFGTIGWIISGLTILLLTKTLGYNIEPTSLPFKVGAVISILLGLYCFSLPKTPPKGKSSEVSIKSLLGLDALDLMKDRSFAVMIIGSLLICIPLTFYYNSTNLFLNEEGIEGAAGIMTMGQMSEIIFLLLMPLFFKRLGVKKMILIGVLAWILRYLLFAYGDNEGLIFMYYTAIILHGVCFDFFFVTGQIYVEHKAPERLRSSAQGLITIATYGIGMFIGSMVQGNVQGAHEIVDASNEIIGHNWTNIWIFPAVLAAIVFVVFAIFFKDEKIEEAV